MILKVEPGVRLWAKNGPSKDLLLRLSGNRFGTSGKWLVTMVSSLLVGHLTITAHLPGVPDRSKRVDAQRLRSHCHTTLTVCLTVARNERTWIGLP